MTAARLKLVLAWTVVAIPLGWGVLKSLEKASPLFLDSRQPVSRISP